MSPLFLRNWWHLVKGKRRQHPLTDKEKTPLWSLIISGVWWVLILTIGDGGTSLSGGRDSGTFLYTALPTLNLVFAGTYCIRARLPVIWTIFKCSQHIAHLYGCLIIISLLLIFILFCSNIGYWTTHGAVGILHIVVLYTYIHNIFCNIFRIVFTIWLVSSSNSHFSHRSTVAYGLYADTLI